MENKKPVIVGIGELLWDVLPTGKRAGGAPVNFVYHATQLGAEGYAISAVGNDLAGTEILQELDKNGIGHSIATVDYPTGTVLVSEELIKDLLQQANVFKLNDEELEMFRPMFKLEGDEDTCCRHILKEYNLKYLVLTAGSRYSTIYSADEKSTIKTPKVKVADTVGAGDSFSGAFVCSILSGKSLKEAHQTAVETAAFVCTKDGAWPVYPKK